jgi:hypothetical protein
MLEARRRLEQKIVDYLDTKAKKSKVTELKTIKPYATVEELAKNLNSDASEIAKLAEGLLEQNRIKIFSSDKKGKKRYYGSTILPAIAKDVSATNVKGSSYRAYGREITINLALTVK